MFICWQDILISRQLDTRIFIRRKIVRSHSILVELFRINNFKLLVRFSAARINLGTQSYSFNLFILCIFIRFVRCAELYRKIYYAYRYSVKSIYSLSCTAQLVYVLHVKISTRITGANLSLHLYSQRSHKLWYRHSQLRILTMKRVRGVSRGKERMLKLHCRSNRVILAFKHTSACRSIRYKTKKWRIRVLRTFKYLTFLFHTGFDCENIGNISDAV